MMKRLLTILSLWLLLSANFGCSVDSESYDLIDTFPIPERAREINKLTLGTKNTQQLFFQITEAYPSVGVLDIYRKYLGANNWTRCAGSMTDWTSHEDLSSGQHLLVHKLTDHWIHPGNSQLLILSAIYYSHDLTKLRPDNQDQRVIIWVQKVSDLTSELSELGIDCDQAGITNIGSE